MIGMVSIGVAELAVLIASTACAADEVFPVVHNEPIAVRVLDGKTGKPQPHTHVLLVAGYDRRDLRLAMWREEAVTDAAGQVQFSGALRNLPLLRVEIIKRHACAPGASEAAASVERIRRDGLSGVNRCGTNAVADTPGVFTVFVTGKRAGKKKAEPETNPTPVQPVVQAPARNVGEKPVPALTENEMDEIVSEPI